MRQGLHPIRLGGYAMRLLGRAPAIQAGVSPKGLHSVVRFREELERETSRSERWNVPLSLLLLEVRGTAVTEVIHARGLELLAEVVHTATRRCDVKGLYQDERGLRIGLLLFNTPAATAEQIVNKLRIGFEGLQARRGVTERELLHLRHEIYPYPTGTHGPRNGRRQDDAPRELHVAVAAQAVLAPPVMPSAGEIQQSFARRRETMRDMMTMPLPTSKRMLDIVGSSVGLVLLGPVMLAIAACVKLSSRGPALFSQERVGQSGRHFQCLKFRSMRTDFDQSAHREHMAMLTSAAGADDKPMQKMDATNTKITWIGRILRPTHFDELPQLINVLRGEMSLVGPRPCIPYEAEQYQPWCHRRFHARPGITGLWQVKGKNKITFSNMVRLDIAYSRRQSLWLDVKILFMTIPTIIEDVVTDFRLKRSGRAQS